MQDDKLIRLIDRQQDPSTLSWSMEQILSDSIEEIKRGELPNKGILIFLDSSNRKFEVYWKKAGVLNHEAIASLELLKADIVDLLRGKD